MKTATLKSQSARASQNGASSRTGGYGFCIVKFQKKFLSMGEGDVWHEFLKRKFIGCIEMPNGQLMGISTTKLSVREMSEYQEKIISWASMEHGVLWD